MYLLDTNIILHIIRKPQLLLKLSDLVSDSQTFISIVTVGEIR